MRKTFDILTALMGRRSWGDWWRIRDLEALMATFDVAYVTFPNDTYARDYFATSFRSHEATDFEQLEDYKNDLKRLEEEAEKMTQEVE
jgi:hypothetical protein